MHVASLLSVCVCVCVAFLIRMANLAMSRPPNVRPGLKATRENGKLLLFIITVILDLGLLVLTFLGSKVLLLR